MPDDVRPHLLTWRGTLLTRYGGLTNDPDCCCLCPATTCVEIFTAPSGPPYDLIDIEDLRPFWPAYDGGSGEGGGWENWRWTAGGYAWCCESATQPPFNFSEEDLIAFGYYYYTACLGSTDSQALLDAWNDYWDDIGRTSFEVTNQVEDCETDAGLDAVAGDLAGQASSAGEDGQWNWVVRKNLDYCLECE